MPYGETDFRPGSDHPRTGCRRLPHRRIGTADFAGVAAAAHSPAHGAYERSAARYAAVRQSPGEPDPFRLRYRGPLREIIADLVRSRVGRKEAAARIAAWSDAQIEPDDRKRFNEIVEAELTGLHEGNFARYLIRPSEYSAWRERWGG